ncbi:MAG: sugar phosphate isomerase/epimerase [Clostridiales bacterium]|nr:sugar phosphate isomerase/epimerase [Clostridiales bacterium]
MRLCNSTNIFNFNLKIPYTVSPENAIAALAAAGYKHIDMNLCGLSRIGKPVSPMTQDDWAESAKRWRRLGDELGVKFTQAHAYFSVDGPVAPGGVPGGEMGEELMRRSVLAAEILGSEYMVTHPFSVVENGKVLNEASYEANLEYFTRWGKFWHEHGIGMAIENMSAYKNSPTPSPFASPEQMIKLVDELNKPDIGICLDTGHAFLSGYDPADFARKVGSRLRATHIADNYGEKDDHIAPFQGNIDWFEFMKALKEIDYKYDFAFEIHNLTSRFPAEVQPDLIKFTHTLGQYLVDLAK